MFMELVESCAPVVSGCTDPTANNYDAQQL